MRGLEEEWGEVLEVLNRLSSVYDRVNRWISLGSDIRLRSEAVKGRLDGVRLVLDAGCGNGVFTRIALRENRDVEVVMLDALEEMLRIAKGVSQTNTHPIHGVFENLPLRDGIVDRILAGFSIRDATRGEEALRELSRVLKDDGEVLVSDILKPDNKLLRIIIGFYWLAIAPILGLLAVGRRGASVWIIWKTYRRWPRRGELVKTLGRFFREVEIRSRVFSGAFVGRLAKPVH